jgi:hypothetical protein
MYYFFEKCVFYTIIWSPCFPASASCHPTNDAHPAFEWMETSDASAALRISFGDGGDDDVALLLPYNPIPAGPAERSEDIDSCIFHGYLVQEKDVYVTLTGCPQTQTFQVLHNKKVNL